MDCFIYKMFYENSKVTTKHKTIVGSQKIKRGELEHTTRENHQLTKTGRKRGEKMNNGTTGQPEGC